MFFSVCFSTAKGDNRILHVGKLQELFNNAHREHVEQNPTCQGNLEMDLGSEKQRGLGFEERLKCSECAYISKYKKLYNTVRTGKRGPETASMNCAIQVALSQSPIGNETFRKFLLSANLPAPSSTSMNRTGQYIQEKIVETNVTDMKNRLKEAKTIQQARGEGDAVPFEADGMYNSHLYAGATKTPMVPSTQSVFTMAENVTRNRQIVQVNIKNKLCVRCRLHRNRHLTGQHAGRCTATMQMQENIGNEEKRAMECMENLLEQGVEVSELTTDGDSSIFKASETLYNAGKLKNRPIHYMDTRHLSDNQRKKIKNVEFSKGFLPGSTKRLRDSMQGRLANDLAKRCEGEFQACLQKHDGDEYILKRKMTYCIPAMVKCYHGDHKECRTHSYVCKGKIHDNWLLNTTYLPNGFKINCSPGDEQKLVDCINLRLGQKILEKTKRNRNSQKVEATNRGLRRSLPRNVTFTSSLEGRAHFAIYSVNNGSANALVKMLKVVGCGVVPGSKAAKSLAALQRELYNRKKYNSSVKARNRRVKTRAYMYKLYDTRPPAEKTTTYRKGMLYEDHTYCKK